MILLLLKGRFEKGISVTQSNVVEEFVYFTGFDTKKKYINF